MKPYVIKQGDYLLKIAHLLGFDADEVWSANAELKALRKDPSMLKAGDVLFVPDEPKPKLRLNKEESNAFVARVPSVKLALQVAEEGEPLKNKKYVIEGLGTGKKVADNADLSKWMKLVDRQAPLWAAGKVDERVRGGLVKLTSGQITQGPAAIVMSEPASALATSRMIENPITASSPRSSPAWRCGIPKRITICHVWKVT